MILPRYPLQYQPARTSSPTLSNDVNSAAPSSSSAAVANGSSSGTSPGIIAGVVVAALVFGLLLSYFVLRCLRKRNKNPRFVPTQYLKRRWEAWQPGSSSSGYSPQLQNETPQTTQVRNGQNSAATSSTQSNAAGISHSDIVERHTSIRSIMTLPAYSRSVRENERIVGREGERDGIDVVVEAPETEHEEEQRRDEEMESLYQIRVQRRREVAEREDRRQRRRAARARGDTTEAERIRQESLNAVSQREATGVAAMINLHQTRNRDRRVGSVSYADVGIARHDGTRIRANSNDSQRPLLDSAASLASSVAAGSSLRPWATRESSSLSAHRRGNASVTSLPISETSSLDAADMTELSPFNDAGSDSEIVNLNDDSSSGTHSRNNSNTVYTPAASRNRSRASTSATNAVRPSIDTGLHSSNADTSNEHRTVPAEAPPEYDDEGFEDAPPYESPIQSRVPSQRLQALDTTLSQPEQQDRVQGHPIGSAHGNEDNQQATASTGESQTLSHDSAEQRSLLPEIARLPSIRIASATPTEDVRPADIPLDTSGSVADVTRDRPIRIVSESEQVDES